MIKLFKDWLTSHKMKGISEPVISFVEYFNKNKSKFYFRDSTFPSDFVYPREFNCWAEELPSNITYEDYKTAFQSNGNFGCSTLIDMKNKEIYFF